MKPRNSGSIFSPLPVKIPGILFYKKLLQAQKRSKSSNICMNQTTTTTIITTTKPLQTTTTTVFISDRTSRFPDIGISAIMNLELKKESRKKKKTRASRLPQKFRAKNASHEENRGLTSRSETHRLPPIF